MLAGISIDTAVCHHAFYLRLGIWEDAVDTPLQLPLNQLVSVLNASHIAFVIVDLKSMLIRPIGGHTIPYA